MMAVAVVDDVPAPQLDDRQQVSGNQPLENSQRHADAEFVRLIFQFCFRLIKVPLQRCWRQ